MSAIANARFCVFALSALVASVLSADDWRDLMWEKYIQLRPGVCARAYALESPHRMKAYVVRIDLTTPGVGFAATERAVDWGRGISGVADKGLRAETTRETTQDFMSRRRREGVNVEVAVNTTSWSPFPAPEGCEVCDPSGWCVADGVEVSSPKKREALFVVRKDGTAGITSKVPRGGTNDIAFAASGFDLLMTNGIDTVSFNRKENASLHPRTAFGLTPDGKTLVLLAVDGRQPRYSDGASLDDVRAILRREGVSDAVNMDGGGSTSLVVWDRKNGRPEMLNRHARNTVRKNAVNFGITFADADPADLSGRLGALYHSYEFEPVEDTPSPEDFKPFYIGHYGRHGSRRATGKCVSDALETIEEAGKAGGLTDEGCRLREAVRLLAEEHEGMEGELSERGAQEHRRLARRMAARFPDVFKGRRRVRCRATTAPRVLASMQNFAMSLKESAPALDFDFTTGERHMQLLVQPFYARKRENVGIGVKKAVGDIAGAPLDAKAIAARFFRRVKAVKSPSKFVRDLYFCASDCQCLAVETCGLDIYRFFKPEELAVLSRRYESEAYGDMGNSAEFGEIFLKASIPLALDILERAGKAIADDRVAADLRFGHDQGVWPLAAAFGLEGPCERVPLADAREKCPVWKWSPMAANFQMVLYRNRKGDTLVKFLYNEREMKVRGIKPVCGPYYRWKELKAHIFGAWRECRAQF